MATGTSIDSPARRTSGFTLLEVMVVLLVIGISLSFFMLRVSPRHQTLQEEGNRLAAHLNMALEEANLNAHEYALELGPSEYRFVRLNGDNWQPLADDEIFRGRILSETLSVRLTSNGEPIPLPSFAEIEDKIGPDQEPARIYLLSSGEVTPFRLELEDRAERTACSLTVTPANLVTIDDGAGS